MTTTDLPSHILRPTKSYELTYCGRAKRLVPPERLMTLAEYGQGQGRRACSVCVRLIAGETPMGGWTSSDMRIKDRRITDRRGADRRTGDKE